MWQTKDLLLNLAFSVRTSCNGATFAISVFISITSFWLLTWGIIAW
jgi:hypothetical protein